MCAFYTPGVVCGSESLKSICVVLPSIHDGGGVVTVVGESWGQRSFPVHHGRLAAGGCEGRQAPVT
jgi:hypothetical protein